MPTSEVVYKGCIHSCADRRKITFRFGENLQFQVGVDIAAGVCSEQDTPENGAKKFIAASRALNARMNIPDKLTGIQKEDISGIAKHAEKEANPLYPVPKLMTKKELEGFYYEIADWSETK